MRYSLTSNLALCLFFFAVGVVALGWPEIIQRWALRFHRDASGVGKWNPFADWMRTSGHVLSLRVVGLLAIIAACLVSYAIAGRDPS